MCKRANKRNKTNVKYSNILCCKENIEDNDNKKQV